MKHMKNMKIGFDGKRFMSFMVQTVVAIMKQEP